MFNSGKFTSLLVCILSLGLSVSWIAGQETRQPRRDAFSRPPKNLKILKPEKPEDLRPIMRSFNAALGVECAFCHDTQNWDKDKPHKEKAREMLEMVEKINSQVFTWDGAPGATCHMCHNGNVYPKFNPPNQAPPQPPAAQPTEARGQERH